MKRAIIYARVSTEEQAQGGYSLPSQLEKCREYATQHGYVIVGEYTDAMSGAKLARPGLDAARKELEQGRADVLIVYTADRLSRNLAHSLILREEFTKRGAELHFVDRGQFEDSAEGRLMQNVEGVIAEYEREKIKERTRRGRIQKAQNGKWVGHSVPYGYVRQGKRQDAKLVLDPEKAQIIRQIFEEFLKGKTMYSIALRLNTERIPAPRGEKGWLMMNIWRVLKRAPMYCRGEICYKGIRTHDPSLAFLSANWVNAVERQFQHNTHYSKRNTKRFFLLSRHVFCHCGKACHAQHRIWKRYDCSIYQCWKASDRERGKPDKQHPTVRMNKLDNAVWRELMKHLDPDVLREGLQALRQRKELEQGAERARLETIDKLVARENRTIETIMSEFGDSEDETVKESAKRQIRAASDNKKSLLREKEELLEQMQQGIPTPEDAEALITLAIELRGKLERATPEQKRQAIDILQVRIDLDRSEGKSQDHRGWRVKKAWLSFVLSTEKLPIDFACS